MISKLTTKKKHKKPLSHRKQNSRLTYLHCNESSKRQNPLFKSRLKPTLGPKYCCWDEKGGTYKPSPLPMSVLHPPYEFELFKCEVLVLSREKLRIKYTDVISIQHQKKLWYKKKIFKCYLLGLILLEKNLLGYCWSETVTSSGLHSAKLNTQIGCALLPQVK